MHQMEGVYGAVEECQERQHEAIRHDALHLRGTRVGWRGEEGGESEGLTGWRDEEKD
jgi:hypothetical protein